MLNTLAGTLYKDFLEGRLSKKPDERRASVILKLLTLGMGCGIILMVFVIEKMGSILEVALTVTSLTTGAIFGMFLLGLFVPWAETAGAVAGAATSLVVMAVVNLGALHARSTGALRYPELHMRTDGCK